ncbi:ornithine cyclodeaminase family protein [Actinoplanes sp. NPDC023801]|uniref:ornithine cyclodeaminase family protein n=1 Tax=Actinoplanes sp. NPDC023801 TaxID=3154595 RepID=UPI0033FB3B25
MAVLVLDAAHVHELLTPGEALHAMREALAALARDEVHQPLRMVVRPPAAAGLMAVMPSYRAGENAAYGLKAVCVFHDNPKIGKDAHQGAVLLFSAATGELQALMNASAITEIRTAAVSAIATDLLARPDAGDLAVLGTGVQARAHLMALAGVRSLRRVRVAGRDPERTRRFAADAEKWVGVPVEPCTSAESAVREADLIVTVTTSAEPVVRREWIADGAHLNAVGSSIPTAREIDTATMAAASLFVDRRESTVNESGDYLFAAREGAIGPDHIRAELGSVLIGAAPGRTDEKEITLFKSLGVAVEDLVAADHLYREAQRRQVGAWVTY